MDLFDLKKKIDIAREELNRMTLNQNKLYQNEDLIRLSEELDVLINEYMNMTSPKPSI